MTIYQLKPYHVEVIVENHKKVTPSLLKKLDNVISVSRMLIYMIRK